MATFDASTASVHVFTEKDGLLSAVAHDLELAVRRFAITVEGSSVSARLEPGSFEVLHALKGGRPSDALSVKDRKDILANLAREVLDPRGAITFASSAVSPRPDGGVQVEGTLTLNGKARKLAFAGRREGARLVAEVPIHQPDFGIRPFSAVMGTLKVKPTVRVRVELPVP